jgi:hypothetical protein
MRFPKLNALVKIAIIPAIGVLTSGRYEKLPEIFNYPKKTMELPADRNLLEETFWSYLNAEKKRMKEEKIKEMYSDIEKILISAFDKMQIPGYITKEFIRSQIWAESRDYPKAIGKIGERGLMQLTPEAWQTVEKEKNFYKTAFNPKANIEVGIKYGLWINEFLKNNHPNWESLPDSEKRRIIAAGYNAGIGRVQKDNWDLSKAPDRTKAYIKDIEKNIPRFSIF